MRDRLSLFLADPALDEVEVALIEVEGQRAQLEALHRLRTLKGAAGAAPGSSKLPGGPAVHRAAEAAAPLAGKKRGAQAMAARVLAAEEGAPVLELADGEAAAEAAPDQPPAKKAKGKRAASGAAAGVEDQATKALLKHYRHLSEACAALGMPVPARDLQDAKKAAMLVTFRRQVVDCLNGLEAPNKPAVAGSKTEVLLRFLRQAAAKATADAEGAGGAAAAPAAGSDSDSESSASSEDEE